jgi:hypothetical protein
MAKFSDLVSAAATADVTVADDKSKLQTDQGASGAAHIAVVSALHSRTPAKADLPQADGTVNEITLTPDGSDFIVTVVSGDFDTAVPPVPPPTP